MKVGARTAAIIGVAVLGAEVLVQRSARVFHVFMAASHKGKEMDTERLIKVGTRASEAKLKNHQP